MSDDPRTDFFVSGGSDTPPAAAQDARTAFFASGGQSEAPSTSPTVYDAALFRKRVGRDPEPAELANFKASKGVGWAGDPTQGKFTVGQGALGAGEDALALGTGAILGVPAAAGGYLYGLTGANGSDSLSAARAARNAVTYQPRSEAGQAGMEVIGGIRPDEIVPRVLDARGYPNAAQTVREVEERVGDVAPLVGEAAAGFPVSRGIGKRVFSPIQDPESAPSASQVAANTVRDSPQSMGAAAAAPRLSAASPQLQAAVVEASRRTGGPAGGPVNPDALRRHVEADTLPVPVQLTEGQALQDPTRLSVEQNMKGVHRELSDRFNEQNGQLAQNLYAIRDAVGPDVYTPNMTAHGDTLIEAYQAKDKAARADIDAAYANARQAIGPRVPVLDARDLYSRVNATLEDKWATGPADIMGRLEKLVGQGDATINAKQFEGLRSRLAELAQSNDGSTRYAAHLIRGVVEDSDLLPGTEGFKAPFDQARSLARQRFQALEADPAYNAAVNEKVSPDKFADKFVIQGSRDNVALMRQNLADNPVAQQTMGVATIDHLRRSAGIDDMGNGNFSQSNFNKQRQALDTKLRTLVGPGQAETLEQLGNVARYTQVQPRGSFVNNSNTFVASAAAHAGDLVEGAVNAKMGGIPGGTWVRNAVSKRSQKAAVRKMLAPGAGLDVLETKP